MSPWRVKYCLIWEICFVKCADGKAFMGWLSSFLCGFMVSVKDVMTKDVVTVESGKTVVEAASVMAEKDLGCLVVVVKGFPVGIVTERDLVRRIVAVRGSFDVRVREVMSKTLVTIGPNVSLREAARVMASNRVRRLPVLDGNRLVGIIGASDFVRSVGRKTVAEEILSAVGRGSSSSV